MERKFTDNEIVKALECCREKDCGDCPMIEYPQTICEWDAFDLAIDLINRQKAEIADERARKELCAEVIKRLDKESETARAEAIKEFADMLKEKIRDDCFAYEASLRCEYIDNLVQEMTGENNGN